MEEGSPEGVDSPSIGSGMASDAEEGIGDGQLEEQEGEEAYELPLRGLRNDQGGKVFPRKLCNPTYVSRLSTMRFHKTVKKFSDIQLGHISKYKMDALLHMPYHLHIPMNMLEWLDQHIFGVREPCFKHKNKVIKITKDMVDKFFDFPGGTVPFVFSSDDPQVKAEVGELRMKYLNHRNNMPINKIEEVMRAKMVLSGASHFISYHLSCVLCRTALVTPNSSSL